PQQLLFRRELCLTLGRDLTHQHVISTNFRTDVNNTGVVQTVQLSLRQNADVAGDFFRSELGIARNHCELFDMDRSVAVVGNNVLGDENRVLEVVAIPGHERDQHVLTQSQFAQVGRCTVSQNVTTRDDVATIHDRTLVDVGVLVGTGVLREVVDIYTHFAGDVFFVVHANHDTLGVNVVNHAATTRLHGCAGVDRNGSLNAGTDQRLLRTQAGNRLALHVGAHQSPVRVVVLQERNQRGSNGNNLRRRHVHVMNVLRRGHQRFARLTASNQVVNKAAFFVQLRVRLGNDVVAFFDGGQVIDLIADLTVDDLVVRRLEEAVLVQTSVQRHRVDQADVRAFRRFDGAHTAVVSRVHVTDFKAGALARQTARSQCRNAPLVRNLGQRVGLVHKLRQLAGTEELLDCRRNRLGVDQVVRHQVLGLGLAQTLLDGTLNTHQAGTELVLGQFANTTYTTVAQVIDI